MKLPYNGFFPSVAATRTAIHYAWEQKVPSPENYAVFYGRYQDGKFIKPVRVSSEPYAELAGVAANGMNVVIVYCDKRKAPGILYQRVSADGGKTWE